jgi:hypothetical protein
MEVHVLRAVGRSENLGVPVLFGGHNLPPLDEIGLTDLPNRDDRSFVLHTIQQGCQKVRKTEGAHSLWCVGHNLPLIDIGLTDLAKTEGPPCSPDCDGPVNNTKQLSYYIVH